MSAAPARLRPGERIELGDYPVDAAWSADGKSLVVAGGEGGVLLLSATAREPPRPIGRHEGGVLAAAWQSAGRLFASSGQDGTVLLWDARSLEATAIHRGKEWSEQLAFADNGRLLAVGTGRALQLFDQQGALRHRFADHNGAIAALAWRPGPGRAHLGWPLWCCPWPPSAARRTGWRWSFCCCLRCRWW